MATKVWGAGSNGGLDQDWINPLNWTGDTAPQAGDDIVFDGNVANISCFYGPGNNLDFNSLTLIDYGGTLNIYYGGGLPHFYNLNVVGANGNSFISVRLTDQSGNTSYGTWVLDGLTGNAKVNVVNTDPNFTSSNHTLTWVSLTGSGALFFGASNSTGNYNTTLTLSYPGNFIPLISQMRYTSVFLEMDILLDRSGLDIDVLPTPDNTYFLGNGLGSHSYCIWGVHPRLILRAQKITVNGSSLKNSTGYSPAFFIGNFALVDPTSNGAYTYGYKAKLQCDTFEVIDTILLSTQCDYQTVFSMGGFVQSIDTTDPVCYVENAAGNGPTTVNFRGRSGNGVIEGFRSRYVVSNLEFRSFANANALTIPALNFYDESYNAVSGAGFIGLKPGNTATGWAGLDYHAFFRINGVFNFFDKSENFASLPVFFNPSGTTQPFLLYFNTAQAAGTISAVGVQFYDESVNKFLGYNYLTGWSVPAMGGINGYTGCAFTMMCINTPKWAPVSNSLSKVYFGLIDITQPNTPALLQIKPSSF